MVVGAAGGGTAVLDGAGSVLAGGTTGVEVDGFSTQRVQVVMVLVSKLVFTTMEVLPLTTVVEVTGQLVKVV